MCATGVCLALSCDGGACEPDPGCSGAFPVCPRCRYDADCDRGEQRLCDRVRGRCVECIGDDDCDSDDPYCVSGQCEECRRDDDCFGLTRCRSGECGIE